MLACNIMLRVEHKTLMGFLCEIRPDFLLCLSLAKVGFTLVNPRVALRGGAKNSYEGGH